MYVIARWKVASEFFKPKGMTRYAKVPHGVIKCSFILIGWVDLNLVIARESIHKGESLVASAVVDDLIDEGRWKVVFGTCIIEIVKVGADADSALFLVDGYRVGNLGGVSNGVNKPDCT
jgi:hypothetical protein